MPKSTNYTDEEILLALMRTMPKKMSKGQIGRLLGIKSAGQKHWGMRLAKLGKQNLLSVKRLDTGELFFGSPILMYYLSDENLEAIWCQYFINYDERHALVHDPFITPFSAGIWNVTSTPNFSKLVGSKFNYYFICAKNDATTFKSDSTGSPSKEKIWKIMDAMFSIGWKTEAYQRKPVLMDTLNSEQKKAYGIVTSIYAEQIKAHPAEYKKFTALFEKNFKYYL